MEKRLKSIWKLALIIGGGIALQQLLKRNQPRNTPPTPQPSSDTMRVMSNIVLPPEAFWNDEEPVPHPPGYTNGAHLHQDDLTEISNIDDAAAHALQELGITRFVDLARADATDLYKELADLPASYERIEGWISAAKERVTS